MSFWIRIHPVVYLFIGLATVLLLAGYFWQLTLDEAYVMARYVSNVADGYGLRWNVDDVRPGAGYSSFLWVVLLTFMQRLTGEDVLLLAKGFSLTIFLLTFFLLWRVARDTKVLGLDIFVIGFVILQPYLFLHMVSGAETSLLMLLVLVQTLFYVKLFDSPQRLPYFLLVSLLTALVQPESLVYSVLLWLGYILSRDIYRGFALIKMTAVLVGLPLGVLFYMRWHYFGYIWTPFYWSELKIRAVGLLYVFSFVISYLVAGLLTVLLGVMYHRRLKAGYYIVLAAFLGQIGYFLFINPASGLGYRYLLPYLPAFLIVVMAQLAHMWHVFVGGDHVHYTRKLFFAVFLILLLPLMGLGNPWEQFLDLKRSFSNRLLPQYIAFSLHGIELQEEKMPVLFSSDIGTLAYLTGWKHYDLHSAVDVEEQGELFSPDRFFELAPDVFVTHSVRLEEGSDGGVFPAKPWTDNLESAVSTAEKTSFIVWDERFQDYVLLQQLHNEYTGALYYVFARHDSPYLAEMSARLTYIQHSVLLDEFDKMYSVTGFRKYLSRVAAQLWTEI